MKGKDLERCVSEGETEFYAIPTLAEGVGSDDEWRDLTTWARSQNEEEEMDPETAFEFWCRWLVERTQAKYDAVVVITGDEGVGKSTLALRMAIRCAELAHVKWAPTEVCYSAVDLIRAYHHAERGRPVWYDEGVRGTMAGEQMTPEQRALIKALALVRETGAILFALYPSIWLAAKQIRARRACLWIHVVHRGLGRVHERDRRITYRPTDLLGLSISPRAPHIGFRAFRETDPVWKQYLRTKSERLGEFLTETEADLKMRGSEGGAMTNAQRQARYRERKRLRAREESDTETEEGTGVSLPNDGA